MFNCDLPRKMAIWVKFRRFHMAFDPISGIKDAFGLIKPLSVVVGGAPIENITAITIHRSRRALTGEMAISVFMPDAPAKAPIENAASGKPIQVLLSGKPFMTGYIDKRKNSCRISADGSSYRVDIAARGAAKYILDTPYLGGFSGQGNETVQNHNISGGTVKAVVQSLLSGHGVELKWQAQDAPLEGGYIIRSNACVYDELVNILESHGLFAYEDAGGAVIVADKPIGETNASALPADRMLSYALESDEEFDFNIVEVNGVNLEMRGRDAVLSQNDNVRVAQAADDAKTERKRAARRQGYGKGKVKIRNPAKAAQWSGYCVNLTIDIMGFLDAAGNLWELNRVYLINLPRERLTDKQAVLDEIQIAADARGTAQTQLGFAFISANETAGQNPVAEPSKAEPQYKAGGDMSGGIGSSGDAQGSYSAPGRTLKGGMASLPPAGNAANIDPVPIDTKPQLFKMSDGTPLGAYIVEEAKGAKGFGKGGKRGGASAAQTVGGDVELGDNQISVLKQPALNEPSEALKAKSDNVAYSTTTGAGTSRTGIISKPRK